MADKGLIRIVRVVLPTLGRGSVAGGLVRVCLCWAAAGASGCTWHIKPPPPPQVPAVVYVTAYGRHTRLALPQEAEPGSMIEYGFGDWQYYALERDSVISGLRALFMSDASALSRRTLRFHPHPKEFLHLSGGERTVQLTVERWRAEALREKLEHQWEALNSDVAERAWENLTLKRIDDDPYHLLSNSNHRAAEWLRELGCEIRGNTILNRFKLDPRAAAADAKKVERE